MALTISSNARLVGSLFSGMSSRGTNNFTSSLFSSSDMLGINYMDYASIKSGSYYKLLDAYYSLDKTSDSTKTSATDKTKVEADLKALKDIIESTDPDAMTDYDVEKIKAGKETLMNSAQELFSKLYEQNGPGANAGTGTGTPDYSDDVVDGDYKEV